jgi:D-cysteine desulfhydrase
MGQGLLLAHRPTPLVPLSRLGAELGITLWAKRDDATGGAEAGNKIRKLERLVADALAQGADTLVTCGGLQSNHARATAIVAARLGLGAVLVLRDPRLTAAGRLVPDDPEALSGNVLLDRMVGAEIRLITAADYGRRDAIMAEVADELRAVGRRPYVIPEGGSNGLGALGYVDAMAEIRTQIAALGEAPFDVVVHACGSGGTAAGCALGGEGVAGSVVAMAVCDDAPTFVTRIETILAEARAIEPHHRPVPFRVDDGAKGPRYAESTVEQRALMVEVARKTGLILDPVYTGKAFLGLVRAARAGDLGSRVLFLHTGGLPGLMAQAPSFRDVL